MVLLVLFLGIYRIPVQAAPVYGENLTEVIREEWKKETIQQPASGQLMAAGPILIKWQALKGIERDTITYHIYMDDEEAVTVAGTDIQNMEYEWYSTATKQHQVKIVAELKDGRKITSSIRHFFVAKKGLGIGRETAAVPQEMSGSWYYNWSYTPDERFSKKMEFVPMIWGTGSYGQTWLANKENQKYRMVLGYNEPDRTDQSNVPYRTAAANQAQFTNSGLRVGAPAVSYPPSWNHKWFQGYTKQVNMDEIDFIPIHCYIDWPIGASERFLEAVDNTYKLYGKPIWITEFAVARWDQALFDGKNQELNREVRLFMNAVIEGLESRPYVERYAWQQFDVEDPYGGSSALFNQNTGKLTELGQIYRRLGNPDGYQLPGLDGVAKTQNVKDEYVQEEWTENQQPQPPTQEQPTPQPPTQQPTQPQPAVPQPAVPQPTTKQPASIKNGDQFVIKNYRYKVTSINKWTVEVVGVKNKNVKSISVNSTVKIKGKIFKVTAIGKGAFKNCKKLVKIKVPKAKYKKYKKLLKNKGQRQTVKIVK